MALEESQTRLLADIVNGLKVQEMSFTVFDVTQTMRAMGEDVRHFDVKPVVHTIYMVGGLGKNYTRTLIEVPEGGQPWLYHSLEKPNAVAEYMTRFDPEEEDAPDEVPQKVVDAKVRLRLPKKMLRAAGFVEGDEVWVGMDPSQNTICISEDQAGMAEAKQHKIDPHMNLRLNLSKRGFTALKYQLYQHPGQILAAGL